MDELMQAVERGDVDAVRSIVETRAELVNARDASGATALHYAALYGHRAVVELLVQSGADVNCRDGEFGATPTGWAVEYLRELGGYLAVELADVAHAIERGEAHWVRRFLTRFPGLREGVSPGGIPFRQLADECGNAEVAMLFGIDPEHKRANGPPINTDQRG